VEEPGDNGRNELLLIRRSEMADIRQESFERSGTRPRPADERELIPTIAPGSSRLRIKEIEASFRIFFFDQTCRFVGQKEFERRPGRGADNVSSFSGSIRKSNDGMGVNRRLPVDQSDVSTESGYFDLLVDLDLPKRVFFTIKPAQQRMLEGAYGREMAGCKLIAFGEFSESSHDFIILAENESVGPAVLMRKQLSF
jgi:hypothetical protein